MYVRAKIRDMFLNSQAATIPLDSHQTYILNIQLVIRHELDSRKFVIFYTIVAHLHKTPQFPTYISFPSVMGTMGFSNMNSEMIGAVQVKIAPGSVY